MTGSGEKTILGFTFGRNPLDDPLVTGWDAVIRNDPTAPPDSDPADIALFRRFHTLETIPAPSPTFFDDLEHHLSTVSPAQPGVAQDLRLLLMHPPRSTNGSSAPSVDPSPADGPHPRALHPGSSVRRPILPRPPRLPLTQRWASLYGAAAVLALIAFAGSLVLYHATSGPSEPPAIPAAAVQEPGLETLVRFDTFPSLLGLPDATTWTHMEFRLFEVAPETSFSTDHGWWNWVDGPLVLTALSGELTVRPAGPAFFYPAGQQDKPPVEIPAGQTISLEPNDTIVYSAEDTATGSNAGGEPALALYGLMGVSTQPISDWAKPPTDVRMMDIAYVDDVPVSPNGVASVSVQRLQLAPFDSFVLSPEGESRYFAVLDSSHMAGMQLVDGAVDGLSPDVPTHRFFSSSQLRFLAPGPHTIFNFGTETVDLYFLVIALVPESGTPTP